MADIRYLNDRDYLMIITEEHLKMLLRDVHDRIIQAEQSAEMDFLEYLDQYYCVKEELARGKMIREYSLTSPTPQTSISYMRMRFTGLLHRLTDIRSQP